ncbi:hypothetical protein MPMin1_gp06 [Microbacterium phage Min1]|uniref:Uncharacterized protein n=1 Tax=Microbacterium phage Min1 TaxID=446529 RepID=A6N1W4_9CAUD|nr:hypothetical protein MPMin1_gp06 [Microbacterium phage Min1]ABR10436.1 hypothetical protein [Microbacterium phage Min1]
MGMELWSGIWTALISACVALLTSITFRWWDRKKVDWLVTGVARVAYESGRRTDLIRLRIEVHNVGDDDAYDVRLRRCNGLEYLPWVTFEAGKVGAGESFKAEFLCTRDAWSSAWIEVIARTSPARREPKTWSRVVLSTRTGAVRDLSPRDEPAGRGTDLPASAGGKLPDLE